ncbi:hypothetical protein P1X14_03855 [Sphingomonas sp. AOB5]|uniref:hypothetical protein n=1 Tax=Sphingomonas sp. AOB5 TaxID=3034017 RepID=UPI0023F9D71E|nr:hypothetical protein [Sphingomonas sp. AOB5]MDF7774370.1 hypothetical protein [Sphingomonas sp. AOB5]
MTGELWAGFAGWLERGLAALDANGLFLAVQLALILIAVPLWLRWLERRRWRGARRQLVQEALALHLAGPDHAGTVAEQLLDSQAPPLARLSHVREAIACQRAAIGRFDRMGTLHAAAMDARLIGLSVGASADAARCLDAMQGLARLYLKEVQVEVAPNVMHGADWLGFDAGQIVSIDDRARIEALAGLAALTAEGRKRIEKALGRRGRAEAAERLDLADEQSRWFDAQVTGFAAGLVPMDPESTSYRDRKGRERTVRTLEGLIARFDRGGVS